MKKLNFLFKQFHYFNKICIISFYFLTIHFFEKVRRLSLLSLLSDIKSKQLAYSLA